MSKAGIQSNRGDGYQTLIAANWALTVMADPDYDWLEVDSTRYAVDDVVAGTADGRVICCQCKKNQPGHSAWTVNALADDLKKAAQVLAAYPKASVRFYSRSNFGELAALREHATICSNTTEFFSTLGKATKETHAELQALFAEAQPIFSVFDFCLRVRFEVSDDFDRQTEKLKEHLRVLVSNPDAAYDALWTKLDQLSMRAPDGTNRTEIRHRLTKSDLQQIVTAAGSILTPAKATAEIRQQLSSVSSIGRSWRRDIVNEVIPTPLVAEILNAIDLKPKSVLLTGPPGSGKTCVMLALQDALEQKAKGRHDLVPVFIQSREFADFAAAQTVQALGLPADWVGAIARLADSAHVVVVVDSLDVLSISREHTALTYFLNQLDRLVQVPSVTVITACRDFDRQYDKRLAQRQWDHEFKCQPLDWETEVSPFLKGKGVAVSEIAEPTQRLLQNPRELALYVELALKQGTVNPVTSQDLTQQYLNVTVLQDVRLGTPAMEAIEAIAAAMLKRRTLSVPVQQFKASDAIRHLLLSNNILKATQEGQLTFGHQSLLDVLVVGGSQRRGESLRQFIEELPPVPFVRPAIRSFIAQLGAGDRKVFRQQIRAAVTHAPAFHIRRLIAECFAELPPHDDDWGLIHDIRQQHPEAFQALYLAASDVTWHRYWLKHLVPVLKAAKDADGLTRHVHRTIAWLKQDPSGVIALWLEALALDWMNSDQLGQQLSYHLSDVNAKNAAELAPLLELLIDKAPAEHSTLGKAVARCVAARGMSDQSLWRYIAGGVREDDVKGYRSDVKLRCAPHEFGETGNEFLRLRMQASTDLLDLAVDAVERWSEVRSYGSSTSSIRWNGFLYSTSYADAHTDRQYNLVEPMRVLFDAIECSVIQHASDHSDWWQENRERLCLHPEGSLRYISILACTKAPKRNLDIIGQILGDEQLLDSELSYELGTLISQAFVYLDEATQDSVQIRILRLGEPGKPADITDRWGLQRLAELILPIPCFLRDPRCQEVVDGAEKADWPLLRKPRLRIRGGILTAPFSHEVLLGLSDESVVRLASHYVGYLQNSFSDDLVGGEDQVASVLREAASRSPMRFVRLLATNWSGLSESFREAIVEGASRYLAIRRGNHGPSSNDWTVSIEAEPTELRDCLLTELETHPVYWNRTRAAAFALQACAFAVDSPASAARVVELSLPFAAIKSDARSIDDQRDLLNIGINTAEGQVAEGLLIVATRLSEANLAWPLSLQPAIQALAERDDPATHAVMLRRLPYLQHVAPAFGWDVFDVVMQRNAPSGTGLWKHAEPCLYYGHHAQRTRVKLWLDQLAATGAGKDLEVWGRLSALTVLPEWDGTDTLLQKLAAMHSVEAWVGAAEVWCHPSNFQQHTAVCTRALERGLSDSNPRARSIGAEFWSLLRTSTSAADVPLSLLESALAAQVLTPDRRADHATDIAEWLNATSQNSARKALDACDLLLRFVERNGMPGGLYDYQNSWMQLLTRLFAYADEMEESDNGAALRRVVAIQDRLLTLGVSSFDAWIKAAERP